MSLDKTAEPLADESIVQQDSVMGLDAVSGCQSNDKGLAVATVEEDKLSRLCLIGVVRLHGHR